MTPTAPGAPAPRDPAMTPETFRQIAQIAYRDAGLVLADAKIAMVTSRLNRRLRALGLPGFDAYLAYLNSAPGAAERDSLISALTTNVSHFFREAHHFATLRDSILPPLIARARSGGRVRIWSAGCSNGQEPYSIAMTVLDLAPDAAALDIRVLGTDIDPQVLAHAQQGHYAGPLASGLTGDMIRRHFTTDTADGRNGLSCSAELRRLTAFRRLNLHDPWPMSGRFDVIFCRNVLIYFDTASQDRICTRFAQALEPQGMLFLGHSERLAETAAPLFWSEGVTTYRKAREASAPAPALNEQGPSRWH